MVVKVLEIRPVRRTSWLRVVLTCGTIRHSFTARVVTSRTEHGPLEGVVFGKDLLRVLEPNRLLAKPLSQAILDVHAGRPRQFPLRLDTAYPAAPRHRRLHADEIRRPVRIAS